MLSDSVLQALGRAATARDRYRAVVLGLSSEPTILLGVETQIVLFALTAADWYEDECEKERFDVR
jgi:hypothetical protein